MFKTQLFQYWWENGQLINWNWQIKGTFIPRWLLGWVRIPSLSILNHWPALAHPGSDLWARLVYSNEGARYGSTLVSSTPVLPTEVKLELFESDYKGLNLYIISESSNGFWKKLGFHSKRISWERNNFQYRSLVVRKKATANAIWYRLNFRHAVQDYVTKIVPIM